MRMLLLLALASVSTLASQKSVVPLPMSEGVTIPVQLKSPLNAKKAHVGDVVRFELLEPILAGGGVVIPANAKLFGSVVDVAPLLPETASRISVLVDRAQWSGHEVAMHAFIAGFGYRRETGRAGPDARCEFLSSVAESRPRRQRSSDGSRIENPPPSTPPDCQDGWLSSKKYEEDRRFPMKNVQLATHLQSGLTWLVSTKHNISVPGGMLMMLRNVSGGGQEIGNLRVPPPPVLKR